MRVRLHPSAVAPIIHLADGHTRTALQALLGFECQPRRSSGAETENCLARWHRPPCDVTDGTHAAPGGTGTATAVAHDPLSWGAGAECEATQGGSAGATDGERTGRRKDLFEAA